MLLLISDANVLIDIEDGNLTSFIFSLPYEIAVPDVLFELELRKAHSHLLKTGLKVKTLNPEFVAKAEFLNVKYSKPSILDNIALALALQERCPLLTGDRDLRIAAKEEGIEVHGTLWIVEELLKAKLIKQLEARNSFDAMKTKGSRLPWGDAEKLLDRWNLVEK